MAASRGYTAIALDRPGYGASALYADEMADADRRVALAFGVVDKIVEPDARGAGVFLVGHSAGCELALRMAVDERGADVLGVEVAGTGQSYAESVKEILRHATATHRPAGLRDMLWQPTDLYPAEVLTGALSAPGMAYEAEVTGAGHAATSPRLRRGSGYRSSSALPTTKASGRQRPEALADIAALFTASPRVVVNEVADSGHNVSVGYGAEAYHRHVLSFVDECVAEPRAPLSKRRLVNERLRRRRLD